MKIITIVPYKGHLDKKFFGKDIIQIGRTFMEEKDFKSEFWTIEKNNKKDFLYKNQKWVGFKSIFQIIINIIKNGKNIDLLHLYHISRYSYLFGKVYKTINKTGKIYLKTDLAYKNINGKKILNTSNWILKRFFNIFDYIGIEDKFLLKEFRKKLQKIKNKFLFIPSGTNYLKEFEGKLNKKNTISLCGRFGDEIKNYEFFLEILEKYSTDFLEKWKIYFIGEYTNKFKSRIKKLLEKKPKLKSIIILKGFIKEKEKLFSILSKSNIFIHTAKSEGEPNVQFDAMFCGCYMISSNVGTIKNNYPKKYCSFFSLNSSGELYRKIKKIVNNINDGKKINYSRIQKFAIKNFIWKKSLEKLLNKF